ncbi:MAG: 2-oxo-4-hydroxy-4-carboxy-5-ureidoimidazoline decarboxylase [Pseudomonadota bacterium]
MATLDELNTINEDHAAQMIAPLIERAPDIAKRVAARRPFVDPESLSRAITEELTALSDTSRIELFRAHPELAPENPMAMTLESQAEQQRLDLTSNQSEHNERLSHLNQLYREKFGFPFIIALARHETIESVLEAFETRLSSDLRSELDAAIGEVADVSAARVAALFGGSKTERPARQERIEPV